MTEPIVQYTLEPLVYVGPAEGKPKEEWRLRSPRELLDLKICDMACGSGAFLVQACRYLSERLVEAWETLSTQAPPPALSAGTLINADKSLLPSKQAGAPAYPITPFGEPATGAAGESLIPAEPEERMAFARRIVAQRCLYGVDKNPLAVEMAKLSLWLLTLAKAKPFTFLDHAIRCGDSLVGLHHLDQIRYFTLDLSDKQKAFFTGAMEKEVAKVIELRQRIEAQPANTVEDVEAQQRLLDEAEALSKRLGYAADLLLSVEFRGASASQKEDLRIAEAIEANQYLQHHSTEELKAAAHKALDGQTTFHWPLEFPEVFAFVVPPSGGSVRQPSQPPEGGTTNGGFDAFVCNPPFVGGQKITGNLGVSYRNFLVEHLANGRKGSADLCAYFFLQAKRLLRTGGSFGLIATNTIAQSDTREVGLDQITAGGGVIYRAVPSHPWPGVAALEVAEVWARNGGNWRGEFVLDELPVAGITSFLTNPGRAIGKPHRLAANANKSFQGSIVLGMGFVLTPEEAQALIAKDERNRAVLFPYLNGEDLNSRPDQSPSRWVINFKDWPLDRSAKGSWFDADEDQIKLWLQSGHVPNDYPGEVAADFPDCLAILREKVKPERDKLANGDATARDRAKRWWRFGRPTMLLYATIAGMEPVLARARIANLHSISFVVNQQVFNEKTVVFVDCPFIVLQSNIHEVWARHYSSSLKTDMQYTPSDCFETFPFPESTDSLEHIGEQYHAHRQSIMLARQEGLTKTYNRFHNPEETAADIQRLRELHQEMDEAVAHSYGWTDLRLGHDFHETKQGVRFTINEAARREVLDRLLELNHRR